MVVDVAGPIEVACSPTRGSYTLEPRLTARVTAWLATDRDGRRLDLNHV